MSTAWDVADVWKIADTVVDVFKVPIAWIGAGPEGVPQQALFATANVLQYFQPPVIRIEGGIVNFDIMSRSPAGPVVDLVDLVHGHRRLTDKQVKVCVVQAGAVADQIDPRLHLPA